MKRRPDDMGYGLSATRAAHARYPDVSATLDSERPHLGAVLEDGGSGDAEEGRYAGNPV
jgi:hypothetical protein